MTSPIRHIDEQDWTLLHGKSKSGQLFQCKKFCFMYQKLFPPGEFRTEPGQIIQPGDLVMFLETNLYCGADKIYNFQLNRTGWLYWTSSVSAPTAWFGLFDTGY